LHVDGRDCVTALEVRTPWRRVLHHATFYGFLLCFASTCVATLYHWSGLPAPYAYASAPVLLGTLGGLGLTIGTAGLLLQHRRRDTELSDAAQTGLDRAFLVLLLLTAVSGLLLLALRERAVMGVLLVSASRYRARAVRDAALRQARARVVSRGGVAEVPCARRARESGVADG
jgi:citrate/tricarballylate utilization protein